MHSLPATCALRTAPTRQARSQPTITVACSHLVTSPARCAAHTPTCHRRGRCRRQRRTAARLGIGPRARLRQACRAPLPARPRQKTAGGGSPTPAAPRPTAPSPAQASVNQGGGRAEEDGLAAHCPGSQAGRQVPPQRRTWAPGRCSSQIQIKLLGVASSGPRQMPAGTGNDCCAWVPANKEGL